jgi:hypothetical protein
LFLTFFESDNLKIYLAGAQAGTGSTHNVKITHVIKNASAIRPMFYTSYVTKPLTVSEHHDPCIQMGCGLGGGATTPTTPQTARNTYPIYPKNFLEEDSKRKVTKRVPFCSLDAQCHHGVQNDFWEQGVTKRLSFGLCLISWEGYTVRKSTRVQRNLRFFSLENPGVRAW